MCVCVQLEAAVERANKYHGDKLSKQMKVSSCVSYGTCTVRSRYTYKVFIFILIPLSTTWFSYISFFHSCSLSS